MLHSPDRRRFDHRNTKAHRISQALLRLALVGIVATSLRAEPLGTADRLGIGDIDLKSSSPIMQKRFDLYRSIGIGILRIDVEWRGAEIEGIWQLSSESLNFMRFAKQNGFRLKANIGAMSSPPEWFFKDHPDAQLINQEGLRSFNVISYWYPPLHGLLEEKDNRLFELLSEHQLLDALSYVIIPFGPAGEPIYPAPWTTSAPNERPHFWYYDPNAQADFPNKMRAKYHDINAANRIWGTQYNDWAAVTVPTPGVQSAPLWRDVLTWYRDEKRNFIEWQISHYEHLLRKYYPKGQAPRLLILVPGTHISPEDWDGALPSGNADAKVVVMTDTQFLIDMAHRAGAMLQYTGLPNMPELQYLQSYITRSGYNVPVWGENAFNAGTPKDLGYEVLANGLYGQEYIGSDLFEADHITPTAKFAALGDEYAWLAAVWSGKISSRLVFKELEIIQNGCIFADPKKRHRLCLQDDGELVLSSGHINLWSSGIGRPPLAPCIMDGEARYRCRAIFQGDGNFVTYQGDNPLWASGTDRLGSSLVLSSDEPSIKILNERGSVIWHSSTSK